MDPSTLPSTQTRRGDWTIEIVDPNGQVLRPTIAGEPEWQPQTNAMPRLHVPVPDRQRWRREDLLTADATEARVWYRGRQLPLDAIVRAEPEPGQVTLVLRGASELDAYVSSHQIDEQETHLALRDLVTTYTSYTQNIDAPSSTIEQDVEVLQASMSNPEDFRDKLAIEFDETQSPAQPKDDTIPIQCYNDATYGGLVLKQTCFFQEAEDTSGTWRSWNTDQDNWYSGSQAIRLGDAGENTTWSFSLDHRVPQDKLSLSILYAMPDGNTSPELDVLFDGTVVSTFQSGFFTGTGGYEFVDWVQFIVGLNKNGSTASGSHNVELDLTSTTGDDIYIDAFAVTDDRFSYTFDQTVQNDLIDGPQLYPKQYRVPTIDARNARRVVAGQLDASYDDTSNQQALGLSNDQGSTWHRESNVSTTSTSFADPSPQIRGEFTLSRFGSRTTQSPATGFEPQVVDLWTLYADLDDTPVLYDQHYSGRLVDILRDAVDEGDFVLEPRRDPAASWDDATGVVVEGAVAGERTRSRVPEDLVDYSAATTVEESYDEIVIIGASKTVRGEQFTSNYDAWVGLDEDWITPGTETVYDPSDGSEYERGSDYTMDWEHGTITVLSSGSMQDSTTYEIDYQAKFRGSATTTGVSDPRTREATIASASSDRECEQLAAAILETVNEPLEEAEVTVATNDPTVSLIEALSHPDLPLEGPLVIRDSAFGTGEVRYRLGSRRSFSDIISELRDRLAAVSRRV